MTLFLIGETDPKRVNLSGNLKQEFRPPRTLVLSGEGQLVYRGVELAITESEIRINGSAMDVNGPVYALIDEDGKTKNARLEIAF